MSNNDLVYKLADGTKVPLFEADHGMSFKVRRADRRGAVTGDPTNCVEARALCRMRGALEAYIGSGKDAYVVFKGTGTRPFNHALHFVILAKAARTRDAFDTNKKLKEVNLELAAPTGKRTLKHRRMLDRERAKAIKAGAPVKKRGTIRQERITRLGVPHRPRAKIVDGVVSLNEQQSEQAA